MHMGKNEEAITEVSLNSQTWGVSMEIKKKKKKNRRKALQSINGEVDIWITCRLLFILKDELKGTIRFNISGGWNTKAGKDF